VLTLEILVVGRLDVEEWLAGTEAACGGQSFSLNLNLRCKTSLQHCLQKLRAIGNGPPKSQGVRVSGYIDIP
jgi:hypothetical protein